MPSPLGQPHQVVDNSAIDAVDRPIAEARGLPNEAYVSSAYFQRERDTLFGRTWTCIGFASDLPEGTYAKPVSMMGLPLLILKDQTGGIRVFHNVCSHRGQLLVQEERPVRGVLRCPYHSWTYDLRGALKGTPHIGGHGVHQAEGFDCADHGLKPVRSEVWLDMIFVNLSGDAPAFQGHVSPLVDRWAEYWGAQSNALKPCAAGWWRTGDRVGRQLEAGG